MVTKERYINLFTDYGFKKIFGEEPNKNLLLDDQLFDSAEIARFTPDQVRSYEKSLKYYRDMKNSLDTAFDEGKQEGKAEGRREGKKEGMKERDREIVIHAFQQGFDIKMIADLTGLSVEEIEAWNPNIKK
ncbi:Transposase/invertase (TIGR01784 family) [Candidatus Electrothrix laxa]